MGLFQDFFGSFDTGFLEVFDRLNSRSELKAPGEVFPAGRNIGEDFFDCIGTAEVNVKFLLVHFHKVVPMIFRRGKSTEVILLSTVNIYENILAIRTPISRVQ